MCAGGIFLDMSSHDFDMARFLVGADIEEVYAQGAAWGPEAAAADDLDTQVTLLRFTNGVFGTIENSRKCSFGYDQRVEVFGDLGALQGQNRAPNTVVRSDASGIVGGASYVPCCPLPCVPVCVESGDSNEIKRRPSRQSSPRPPHPTHLSVHRTTNTAPPYSFFMDRYAEAYVGVVRAFVAAVAGSGGDGSEFLASAADGKATILAGMAARASVDGKRPVKISEVKP